MKYHLVALKLTLLLCLSACGGSSGGTAAPSPPPPPPPAPIPVTAAEAFQFLNQATFGATEADVQAVIDLGIEGWVDEQIAMAPSLQLPYLRSLPAPMFSAELNADRIDVWFRHAIDGPDQLRQRVAFALSEILVVSQNGALIDAPYALADYYDQLALHAFGNYRDLLEVVALHPAMGVYLSMLGNEKPDAARNIRPDENFAREFMQLFTIGLVELNADGSPRLDGAGRQIPTYDQAVIEGFAHINTGWNYAGAPSFEQAFPNAFNQTEPMQLYPAFHDTGQKTLLNGFVVPAGQSGMQDLTMAIDNVFNHPNVGPFVAYRLLQRLVTSNPSPAYVERIASVFDDNGFGVRGDLAAVVRAILLDSEARPEQGVEVDGKLKEPLLRLTQFWRAFGAQSQSGAFPSYEANFAFGQGPLQSPSVFNFFSPFHAPAGAFRDAGYVAPELEIATEYQNALVTTYFFLATFIWNSANVELDPDIVFIDIDAETVIADDTDALIESLDVKLLGGAMSATLRTEVSGMVDRIGTTDAAARVAEAIFLVVSSPEFAYQH